MQSTCGTTPLPRLIGLHNRKYFLWTNISISNGSHGMCFETVQRHFHRLIYASYMHTLSSQPWKRPSTASRIANYRPPCNKNRCDKFVIWWFRRSRTARTPTYSAICAINRENASRLQNTWNCLQDIGRQNYAFQSIKP